VAFLLTLVRVLNRNHSLSRAHKLRYRNLYKQMSETYPMMQSRFAFEVIER
jgi:hypothetical protein